MSISKKLKVEKKMILNQLATIFSTVLCIENGKQVMVTEEAVCIKFFGLDQWPSLRKPRSRTLGNEALGLRAEVASCPSSCLGSLPHSGPIAIFLRSNTWHVWGQFPFSASSDLRLGSGFNLPSEHWHKWGRMKSSWKSEITEGCPAGSWSPVFCSQSCQGPACNLGRIKEATKGHL